MAAGAPALKGSTAGTDTSCRFQSSGACGTTECLTLSLQGVCQTLTLPQTLDPER
jgi:hypothetical protein